MRQNYFCNSMNSLGQHTHGTSRMRHLSYKILTILWSHLRDLQDDTMWLSVRRGEPSPSQGEMRVARKGIPWDTIPLSLE